FQAEDGIRDRNVTGVQTCALPILGGGLSNLLDRVAYGGYVVDFINLGIGSLRTGIFNAADVAITVGVLLVVFGGQWQRKPSASKIGRASCRERVEMSVVGGGVKRK